MAVYTFVLYYCIESYCVVISQDFILEHYSEDGNDYEEEIADLMDLRQVRPGSDPGAGSDPVEHVPGAGSDGHGVHVVLCVPGVPDTDPQRGGYGPSSQILQPPSSDGEPLLQPQPPDRTLLHLVLKTL